MSKIIRLTERDLTRLVKRVIKEQKTPFEHLLGQPDCKSGDKGHLFFYGSGSEDDPASAKSGFGWGLSSSNNIVNLFCKVPGSIK